MLVLLPPSEGKASRDRGRPLDLTRISFPELGPTRERVITAVERASARDDAPSLLGVSPSLRGDIDRNLRLHTAATMPAGSVYRGVLYEALDLHTLDPAARRRVHRWVVIISALFGAVRLTDPIVPYRLSMSVNLPGIGPLASAWRPDLERVLPAVAGRGVVLDCRSSTYAAAWTPVEHAWVHVRVPGATHQAKHTRGLVVRHLAERGTPVRRPEDLPEAMADRFVTSLEPPTRPGRPWVLEATARS